ncbi:hypothetical protein DFQ27_004392, partial [Actinomortierella ambigua]
QRIGSGAYGEVFIVEWGGIHCAAKKLLVTQEELHQVQIQKEISILYHLRHRNVIQFYATHEHEEHFYLIMDLAEKGDLSGAIKHKSLNWKDKTRIAHEIARGLEYIHSLRIIHRDLKSANVLLTKHMEARLCDFGLAEVRSISTSRSGGGVEGTIRWMAPELFSTKPKYSSKSDIYALGVVMWEMAADCTTPFKYQINSSAVMLAVVRGEREIVPEGTPDDYRRFLERCWDQDPRNRPLASEVILMDDEMQDHPDGKVHGAESPQLHHGNTQQPVGSSRSDKDFEDLIQKMDKVIEDLIQEIAIAFPSTDFTTTANTFDIDLSRTQPLAALTMGEPVDDEADRGLESLFTQEPAPTLQDAEGWVNLAGKYRDGDGLSRSDSEAFRWYQRAADWGHVVAQRNLGELFLHGRGTQQSDSEAAKWYQKAAEQGDALSQVRVGCMYSKGEGVELNDIEAASWWRMAAEKDNLEAQFKLGCAYSEGRGVDQSDAKAMLWWQKAATQGHAGARIGPGTDGLVYHAQLGEDPCAARRLFLTSSDYYQDEIQKEIQILYSLRHSNIIQLYCTQDYEGYTYIIMDLAENGNLAQSILDGKQLDWPTKSRFVHEIALGLEYLHDLEIIHQNLKSDNVLLTKHMVVKLCNFGLVENQSNFRSRPYDASKGTLRWMAPELLGSTPNYSAKSDIYALGVVMWEMAADCTPPFKDHINNGAIATLIIQGEREIVPEGSPGDYRRLLERCWGQDPANRPTASEIVLLNKELAGTPGDDGSQDGRANKSLESDTLQELIQKAAADNVDAQMMLAAKFESGNGIAQSDSEAFRWYHRAAKRNHASAQYHLGELFFHGRGTPQSDSEAIEWYRKAAEQGDALALFRLGWMYENGFSVKKSEDTAFEWFLKAARLGHAESCFKVGLMYASGVGISQNHRSAVSWYHEAAKRNHTESLARLGTMYHRGHGVEQNDVKAALILDGPILKVED